VEVYPAASLVQWGFDHRNYKRTKNHARLEALVDELKERARWLDLGEFEPLCRKSDDAFDAVIAGLTARASALGMVEAVPGDKMEIAAVEGWIALPTKTSLEALRLPHDVATGDASTCGGLDR
jgi:predicted nuclease with RNAse H fold